MIRELFCVCIAALIAGGCTFTQKIKSGNDAFAVRQYAVAAEMLQAEYEQSDRQEDRARKAFMIGQCYEYMRLPEMAVPWYQRAYDHRLGAPALERYAETLKQSERYVEAIAAYEELMQAGNDVQRFRGQITLCNQAIEWKKDQDRSPYKIRDVAFNSAGSDYSPYLLGPELLLFTSDRKSSTGSSVYNWTGRSFSDLYTVNVATGLVQPFEHIINSPANEGTIAFTSDRSEMYFTRCFSDKEVDSYCKLMMCRSRGASWSEPEVLSFVKEGINYGHPVITHRDSLLLFSANDPEGTGGYDIYYSQRTDDGWGTPVLLSERINTIGNERFPFMYRDTMYFSSDHHPGLGGYDIFKTYLDARGQWTPPLNLKPPINSGWDDFGFVVDTFNVMETGVLEQGYFSSSRNTNAADDIYSYKKVIPEPEPEPETPPVVETKPIEYKIYVAIRTVQPVFANPDDPNSERTGKEPLPATVIDFGEGDVLQRERTNANGLLILEVDWENEYQVLARKGGFFNQNLVVSTDIEKDPENPIYTHNVEILMEPIFEDTEVILQDIYYDYDEWFIREDAKPALTALAKTLRENPQLRIQLSSHTDCRGEDDYNQDLSQKRAQSAVDFLSGLGIPASRMIPVGYGESRLAVDCECTQCSEDEHQQNRRTTFKILTRE